MSVPPNISAKSSEPHRKFLSMTSFEMTITAGFKNICLTKRKNYPRYPSNAILHKKQCQCLVALCTNLSKEVPLLWQVSKPTNQQTSEQIGSGRIPTQRGWDWLAETNRIHSRHRSVASNIPFGLATNAVKISRGSGAHCENHPCNLWKRWKQTGKRHKPQLVGGFNPSEKYYIVKLDHETPNRDENLKKNWVGTTQTTKFTSYPSKVLWTSLPTSPCQVPRFGHGKQSSEHSNSSRNHQPKLRFL